MRQGKNYLRQLILTIMTKSFVRRELRYFDQKPLKTMEKKMPAISPN